MGLGTWRGVVLGDGCIIYSEAATERGVELHRGRERESDRESDEKGKQSDTERHQQRKRKSGRRELTIRYCYGKCTEKIVFVW